MQEREGYLTLRVLVFYTIDDIESILVSMKKNERVGWNVGDFVRLFFFLVFCANLRQ